MGNQSGNLVTRQIVCLFVLIPYLLPYLSLVLLHEAATGLLPVDYAIHLISSSVLCYFLIYTYFPQPITDVSSLMLDISHFHQPYFIVLFHAYVSLHSIHCIRHHPEHHLPRSVRLSVAYSIFLSGSVPFTKAALDPWVRFIPPVTAPASLAPSP